MPTRSSKVWIILHHDSILNSRLRIALVLFSLNLDLNMHRKVKLPCCGGLRHYLLYVCLMNILIDIMDGWKKI